MKKIILTCGLRIKRLRLIQILILNDFSQNKSRNYFFNACKIVLVFLLVGFDRLGMTVGVSELFSEEDP